MSNYFVFLILTILILNCSTGVNADECEGKVDGDRCSSDCQALLTCKDGKITVTDTGDPDELCIDGTLTNIPGVCPDVDEEIVETDTSFICSTDGKFPDTRDCSRYYNCENNEAKHPKCPDNEYFDSKTLQCLPKDNENGQCKNTVCKTGTRELIPYEMNPSFYTICNADGKVELKQCVDVNNQIFNGTECVFQCKKRAIYTDMENCHQFYVCRSANDTATIVKCIKGYRFDNGSCVRETTSNAC